MLDSIINLSNLSVLIALVVAVTIHEFSHAFAANYLGDPTAKYAGRLSLNPIRHLDPVGTVVLLIFLFTVGWGFGWGKPVPVNPYNLRHRYGELLVSLAGPLSNFLLAIIVVVLLALLPPGVTKGWSMNFFGLFNTIISLNVVLGIFNLLPIPPLDGSKILFDLLPAGQSELKSNMEKYGLFILIAVIFFGSGLIINLATIVLAALQYLEKALHGAIY